MAFLVRRRLIRVFTVGSLQPCGAAISATMSSAVSGLRRHRASMTRLSAALIFMMFTSVIDQVITSVIDGVKRLASPQSRLRDGEELWHRGLLGGRALTRPGFPA